MTTLRDLQALAQLTGAVFATQQAQMGALRQAEQAIRDKLAGLENARRARALSLTDPDPALLAGADLLWQTWIEQRRAALNGDLSRVLLAQETARAALGRAFGRDQVTEALNARARSDRVKTKARRDEGAS